MNEIIQSLLAHRSIRTYSDRPVEENKLEQIISAVQAAPNWVNLQLTSIIAVKDPKRRQILSRLCGDQPYIAQAPVFLVFCADYYRVHLACQKMNQSMENILKDIDTLIVGAHEAGIAIATAVIAAEGLGLGTVVIGDIRKNPKEVIEELNLPPFVMPMLGLCIGYPAHDPGIKPRLPREAVYFEERYQHNLGAFLDEYDQTYARYLKKRPWNDRIGNWTTLAADFYRKPYHYKEVANALRQQKFFAGMKESETA